MFHFIICKNVNNKFRGNLEFKFQIRLSNNMKNGNESHDFANNSNLYKQIFQFINY